MYFLSFSFADRSQMLVDCAYFVQRFAFKESTKRNKGSQLHAYLIFCAHYQFSPFPVSKNVFLAYLVFLSHSLASYKSLHNYTNILKHINYALGPHVSFMSDYDFSLTKRGLRRVMGDRVYHTSPITVDILLRIPQSFQLRNVFHACMQLFWSHFLESPIWFRTLCLKFIPAPVSSFIVGI